MVACTFCGSEDTRRSGSSTLDSRATRVKRALSWRRLYRCRNCDGLFEAPISAWDLLLGRRSQPRGQKSNGSGNPSHKIPSILGNTTKTVLYPHRQSAGHSEP
jgi:hypothetical protein